MSNRPVKEPRALTGVSVLFSLSEIRILDAAASDPVIGTSRRIGVTKDLDRDLRFYVEGNPYVSR